eukprot:TRINITY_DN2662_c0_g1_i4.p1 TRINITY_DN2662_c0_g1~~TRINITY_DN2662_c0_g1_i4.p1  ORF type:complete len:257 (-),score=34.95 TRINITY_DN2662_c0_g1_i4:1208-1978(-)
MPKPNDSDSKLMMRQGSVNEYAANTHAETRLSNSVDGHFAKASDADSSQFRHDSSSTGVSEGEVPGYGYGRPEKDPRVLFSTMALSGRKDTTGPKERGSWLESSAAIQGLPRVTHSDGYVAVNMNALCSYDERQQAAAVHSPSSSSLMYREREEEGLPGVRLAVVTSPRSPKSFSSLANANMPSGSPSRFSSLSRSRGEGFGGGGRVIPKGSSTSAKGVLSLVDSPLIGAPFRFMSMLARYVAGADLVEANGYTTR